MSTGRANGESGVPRTASAPADAPGAGALAKPVGLIGLIGLIGLGLVGRALGARLRRAGFSVLGLDRDAAAQAAWVAEGGALAAGLRSMGAACATVVLAVYDTAGVLQVLEGDGGLLQGGAPGLLIDCSTGDPEALEALAARLADRGSALIEAPLSGSSQQIADGQATMLLGGTVDALALAAPVLDVLATRRVHVGGPGMGARAKLATNLVLGLNRAVLAEGLVFAERLGIAPQAFLDLVLATPARSDAALAKGMRMVTGDFAPQSRIRQHLKDLDLMQAAAAQAGIRHLPLTQRHAELLRRAVAAGDGDLDNAAIVRQLRREAEGGG